jgi:hypothetical protein
LPFFHIFHLFSHFNLPFFHIYHNNIPQANNKCIISCNHLLTCY